MAEGRGRGFPRPGPGRGEQDLLGFVLPLACPAGLGQPKQHFIAAGWQCNVQHNRSCTEHPGDHPGSSFVQNSAKGC